MKYIHIIWLGPNPMYDKYLPSIREYCPKGFDIKVWRDAEVIELCKGCPCFDKHYQEGKWAFCSDYARFKILYTYGGMYIDTDVEFIKPIDDLIEKGSFFASEKSMRRVTSGLIIYMAEFGNDVMKGVMDYYEKHGTEWEYLADGEVLAGVLKKYGYVLEDTEQHLSNGMTVYKGGTFDGDRKDPESYARAIHWYTHFWVDPAHR